MRTRPDKPPKDEQNPFQMEKQNNARAALRVLLALYLAYIIYKLIQGYVTGSMDLSFPLFCAAVLLFVAAEAGILLFAVKRWKRGRARIDQVWDTQSPPEEAAGSGSEQQEEDL